MNFKEKAQDLFIPVGRRKSVALSQDADSPRIKPATWSVTTPVKPAAQRQAQSPQNRGHKSHNAGESRNTPSTGGRYIISPASEDRAPAQTVLIASSSPTKVDEQKSRKHLRRLSGRIVPQTSPITNLTSRLKRVLRTDQSGLHADVESQTLDHALTSELQENFVRIQAPTPFTSPETTPVLLNRGENERPRNSTILTAPTSHVSETLQDDGRNLTQETVNDRPIRSQSRGSNHSSRDRSHPPPSFPVGFYNRFPGTIDNAPQEFQSNIHDQVTASPKKSKRTYTISAAPTDGPRPDVEAVLSSADNFNPGPYLRPAALTPAPEFLETKIPTHATIGRRDAPAPNLIHKRNPSDSPKKSVSHSRSSSASQRSEAGFHSTVHHYTDCHHTSPPATRPLNVQPRMDNIQNSDPDSELIARSVITGSCFDCDTAARRDEETRILIRFNGEIGRLEDDILQINGDSEVPISPITPKAERPFTPLGRSIGHESSKQDQSPRFESNFPATPKTTRSRATSNAALGEATGLPSPMSRSSGKTGPPTPGRDSDYVASVANTRTQSLQLRIRSLLTRRDSEIRGVWKGYTARWGPGTLGVVRANTTASARHSYNGPGHSRNVSRSTSTYSQRSGEAGSAPQTRSRASSLKNKSIDHDEQGSGRAPSTPGRSTTASTNNGSARRGHYRGTSRESTFSNVSYTSRGTGVTFEASADTPEGRMRVDWVRQ